MKMHKTPTRLSSAPWTVLALAAILAVGGCGDKSGTTAQNDDPAVSTATSSGAGSDDAPGSTATSSGTDDSAVATTKFVNSREKNAVAEKLAANYVDFSFDYPSTWTVGPGIGSPTAQNFIKVIRPVPEGSDFEPENFAVGYFSGSGAEATDKVLIPQLIQKFEEQLKAGFPKYQKLGEGETTVGDYKGYELRFESHPTDSKRGEITLWGKLVFLPGPAGKKEGVTLVMLASDVAPEIKSIDDLGTKGELPVILNSFKLGE